MEEIYLSGYLEGLLNMASSLSSYIGPSYIKVDCYNKKSFKEDFCKNYEIKDFKMISTEEKLDSPLLNWLNNKKIVDDILYWFGIHIQGDKKVYYPEKSLINILDDKQKDFYTLEDIFFIETTKYVFVFLLGNNE